MKVDERQRHGRRRIRLDLMNGMRIAGLTTVADESRTMLRSGLAYSSRQCQVGHLGAAIAFLAQIGAEGIRPVPLFLQERLARARGWEAQNL
jgi:hypothetical protein